MGDAGSVFSICQNDYSDIVNALNSYVNNVSENLSFQVGGDLPEVKIKTFRLIAADGSPLAIPSNEVNVIGSTMVIPEIYRTAIPPGSKIIGEFEHLVK